MLELFIKGGEFFDSSSSTFINVSDTTICLEHSLVSLTKWESKWKKPFLSRENKTIEETIDYIKCMTLTENVDPMVYNLLDDAAIKKIQEYIEDPMTATTFREDKKGSREIITSEIIYYWMFSLYIPIEFQEIHLNRLLAQIKVGSIKNEPPKKMKKQELMNRNRSLNAARRAAANSRG